MGQQQTPEMGAQPEEAPAPSHAPTVLTTWGHQGTGQALLSLRYAQVRGQQELPANPAGVHSLGRKQRVVGAEADGSGEAPAAGGPWR